MLTHERLLYYLDYNPNTGIFTWKNPQSYRMKEGDKAGGLDKDGYTIIKINSKAYKAHKLAWFYTHKVWPKDEIDHKNRKRSDNCIINLHECTHWQNSQNRANKNPGVGWRESKGKWRAYILVKSIQMHLGYFTNKEEAIAARVKAEELHFPEQREALLDNK